MYRVFTDHQFTRRKRVHVVFDEAEEAVFIDRSLWRCLCFLIENDVHVARVDDGKTALLITLKRDQGSISPGEEATVPPSST